MTGDGPDVPDLADRRDVETVYQAAEDSKLLADAVIEEIEPSALVLDVGTGSGYVGERIETETGARVVATDVNPDACRQAREAGLAVVRADLASPVRDDAVDVVVFNPPYLPTDPDAEWGDWMETALSGGPDGRAVVEPFLADVGRVLRPGGVAYLLVSTLTGVPAVRDLAAASGLAATTVAESNHPFERLVVLRLTPARE